MMFNKHVNILKSDIDECCIIGCLLRKSKIMSLRDKHLADTNEAIFLIINLLTKYIASAEFLRKIIRNDEIKGENNVLLYRMRIGNF